MRINLGIYLFLMVSYEKAFSCDQLESQIAAIQAGESTPLAPLAENLLCGSLESTDRVMFWLTFQAHRQSKADELPPLLGRYQKIAQTKGSKDPLFTKARAGDPEPLQAAIKGQKDPYARNPAAHLILARALARKGQWLNAIPFYESYLYLNRSSVDAEVEKLYLLILAGRLNAAESYHRKLSSYENSNAMTAILERAAKVLTLPLPQKSALGSEREVITPSDLSLTLENRSDNTKATRSVVKAQWSGDQVAIFVDHYQKETALDTKVHNGSNLGLKGEYDAGMVRFSGALSHYERASNSLMGRLEIDALPLSGVDFEGQLAFERTPLIAKEITYEAGLESFRTSFGSALRFQEIRLVAMMAYDNEEDPFEVYTLSYDLLLAKGPGIKERMGLEFGLKTEQRSKASPFYETFEKVQGAFFEYQWVGEYSARSLLSVVARYENLRVKPFGEDSFDEDAQVSFEGRYDLTYRKNIHYFLSAAYWQRFNEDLPVERKFEKTFGAGVRMGL